jgi:hypothetical protein
MSNTDKATEQLVSSIRSGKATGRTGGKKPARKKKPPTSGKATSGKPAAGRRLPGTVKNAAAKPRPGSRGPSAYALGGLRWPD